MENRRQFLKKSLGFMGGAGIFFLPFGALIQKAYGKAKRIILPKGTKRKSLVQKNPGSLDTRNLEITPIEDFETMGINDYKVDLAKWRFMVEGYPNVRIPANAKKRGAGAPFPWMWVRTASTRATTTVCSVMPTPPATGGVINENRVG